MTASSATPGNVRDGAPVIHLSQLLHAPLVTRSNDMVGRVEDVIVRLTGTGVYPLVTGIVVEVGRRRVFVGTRLIETYRPDRIVLATNELDLRTFERREGEVLLRADVPMLLLSHPDWSRAARDVTIPGIAGGVSSDAVLLVIAIVGTTVAPWQLFFQQSNIVDKRITPRFICYERTTPSWAHSWWCSGQRP